MNDQLSEKVIGAAYKVHNQLGFGFLESVYEKALRLSYPNFNWHTKTHSPITVYYDDHVVGDFFCDVILENRLVVELKSVTQLHVVHEVQLVNYLNATKIDVGLLLNFGQSKVEVKRKYRTAKSD